MEQQAKQEIQKQQIEWGIQWYDMDTIMILSEMSESYSKLH